MENSVGVVNKKKIVYRLSISNEYICFPGSLTDTISQYFFNCFSMLRNWNQNLNWFWTQTLGFAVVSILTKRLWLVEESEEFSYTVTTFWLHAILKSGNVFVNIFSNDESHASSWEKELSFLHNKNPPRSQAFNYSFLGLVDELCEQWLDKRVNRTSVAIDPQRQWKLVEAINTFYHPK